MSSQPASLPPRRNDRIGPLTPGTPRLPITLRRSATLHASAPHFPLRVYLRQAGESLEMRNWCAEIKIRAERRAGELLQEMEKHPPGPDQSEPQTDLPPRLRDLGFSKDQSGRLRTI